MPNQTTDTKAATRTTGLQLFGTPSPVGMPVVGMPVVGMPVVGMPVGGRVGCRFLLHIAVVQHSIPQEVTLTFNCCSRYSSTLLQAFVLSRRNRSYENIVPK